MVEVYFNVYLKTVDCPGVWLCSKGNVQLKLSALDTNKYSKKIFPKFPLKFNEPFKFQKNIIIGIHSIIHQLESECLQVELLQFNYRDSTRGIVLAEFNQKFCYLFKPFIVDDEITIETDVELLMSQTKNFPGIISPKIYAKIRLKMQPYRGRIRNNFSSSNLVNQCSTRQQSVCHYDTMKFGYPSSELNLKCFSCSSRLLNNEKENKIQFEGPIPDSSLCYWCNEGNTCRCCICWKYHLKFHRA